MQDLISQRFGRGRGALLTALVLFCAGAAPVGASALDPLQPHQAQYRLDVMEVGIPGAEAVGPGVYTLRVQRRCQDWVLLTQLDLSLGMENGQTLTISSIGSNEEALDGSRLRFDSTLRMNDTVVEALKGQAVLRDGSNGGSAGEVVFEGDEPVVVPLPPDAQFPVAAFRDTMEGVAAGERVVNYVLFDGSSRDAVRGVDFVTGPADPPAVTPQGDAELLTGPAWRVVSSYYDIKATDAEPQATNTIDVYRNGVTSSLLIDLGVATVQGTLMSVTALPEPDC